MSANAVGSCRFCICSFSIIFLMGAVVGEIWATPASSGEPTTAEEVRALIEQKFVFPDRVPNSVPAQAKTELRGATEREEIDGLLASLRTSHVAFYPPSEIGYYELADIYRPGGDEVMRRVFPPDGRPQYLGIGVMPKRIGGKTFVGFLYAGGPADRSGLRLGDELIAVDGEQVQEIASFSGKIGKKVAVQRRSTATSLVDVIEVEVESFVPQRLFVSALRESSRLIETEGKHRLAYVRIPSFTSEEVKTTLRSLFSSDRFKEAEGLVLDLRCRWGGAPPDAVDLFLSSSPVLASTGRMGQTRTTQFGWRKPVVAIIDGGVRSGMEILAYALKARGVPLVGTKTAGAVVGAQAFLLNDKSLLLLAVQQVLVDGKPLEGIGVEPDREVDFDIRYANGRDPQFDEAVKVLNHALDAGNSTPQ